MAPYHILIVIISSVIPENLVLLTKSEQSGPKSAHIRPTIWYYIIQLVGDSILTIGNPGPLQRVGWGGGGTQQRFMQGNSVLRSIPLMHHFWQSRYSSQAVSLPI